MKLPYRILVVDTDDNALAGWIALLREKGYAAMPAADFEAAKTLLALSAYDLLITNMRLRSFNGLHLVMKVREKALDTAVILMTDINHDGGLMELDARRYHAELLKKPIGPSDFMACVERSLTTVRRQRRWPRKRISGGFRAQAAGMPAAVLEVSYGGLRLEILTAAALPARFDVEVSSIGLRLTVESVWSSHVAGPGALMCCAALTSDSSPAARTWRVIVDRLNT